MFFRPCFESCRCCANSREYHERVRYHAKRFEAKWPEEVLRRYELRRQKADLWQLQKCTFHVASWVATLATERMTCKYADISAVSLLVGCLKALKDVKPLCAQLVDLLKTVLEHSSSNAEDPQWRVLSSHILPMVDASNKPDMADTAAVTNMGVHPKGRAEKGTKDLESGLAKDMKAVRLLQTAVQIWRNETCETSQEAYVASLEETIRDLNGTDLKRIRWVFRRAVAALSPPRVSSEHDPNNPDRMQEIPEKCASFQHRLRKVVLWCLDHLDLTDDKVKPALQLLECLLQKFEDLVSSQEGMVGSSKQWLRLQMKSGLFAVEAHESPSQDMTKKRKAFQCQHGVQKHNCRTCNPCPHAKVRRSCVQCSGCPHGQLRSNCAKCTGCPHGKFTRSRCVQCLPCPHGKVKRNCADCSGCPHGNVKMNCGKCRGCPHGRARKVNCPVCCPCPHGSGKIKRYCRQCSGCEHGRVKLNCRLCKEQNKAE